MSKLSSLFCGTAYGKVSTLLLASALGGLVAGQAAAAPVQPKLVSMSHVAAPQRTAVTVNLRALGAASARDAAKSGSAPQAKGGKEYRNIPLRTVRPHHVFTQAEAAVGAPEAPSVSTLVAAPPPGASFVGLDHFDQRNLADNGNQFSLEPPDQALAVGKGRIVEVVNSALQVYDTSGNALLAAPVSVNRFFGLPSEFDRTTLIRGPFMSDPRAYYDWATQRFFVAEFASAVDANGNDVGISVQYLAVSQTSDPTAGWNIYSYSTTNGNVAGCPCLPDYNQLGIDASGVYITNNLFSYADGHYVGASIYALPKAALESGGPANVLQFPVLTGNFTVHPTVSPPHSRTALENGGTEYALENVADFTDNGIGKAINVFAITNTRSLAGSAPSLGLQEVTLATQRVSANLPPAIQMNGPRPLGDSLGEPVPMLESLDGRFASNPVYVNGTIWAVTPTAVRDAHHTHDGVAWYQLTASGNATSFNVSLTNQGIIAGPQHTDLIMPAIAMNAAGVGYIGVTITGKTRFPSSATIAMPQFGGPIVKLAGVGALPDDGFTAYPEYGGNGVGRWGDYGAASMDEFGNFWMANEYIPNTNQHPRTLLANWGTYVQRLAP